MNCRSGALLVAGMLAAVPAHAQWMSRTVDGIMGTRIYVEIWADDPAKGEAAIDAVMDEMRHIDETMSTYKPTSEVSKVNALAAKQPVPISLELFKLLGTALEYSRITEGAFDITYASVGYMYDFRERKRPTEEQIAAALPAVNYRHVLLDPKTHSVRFSQPGVRIDLGGIAKGYSVDCGIDVLKAIYRGSKVVFDVSAATESSLGIRSGIEAVIPVEIIVKQNDMLELRAGHIS